MITKEDFVNFINSWIKFEEGIDRVSDAISGDNHTVYLYETDWYEAVGAMFDTFVESHFTDEGADLINDYMFGHIDKREVVIYEEPNIFKAVLETPEELFNYLDKEPELYIK